MEYAFGMKGIILAGGTGSRLWPLTKVFSKQLLPIFDKPMIYYPLTTLMLSGIREILIICTEDDLSSFKKILGDGSQLGINLKYKIQVAPNGIAEAFILGEKFIDNQSCALILGDNIFHGAGLGKQVAKGFKNIGAEIFAYPVDNPSDYGVVEFSNSNSVISLEEKPINPKSKFAVTGMYIVDRRASEIAKSLKPSKRGELEITNLLINYLLAGELKVNLLSRGTVWLDTGTPKGLHDASTYVRVIEERSSMKIGCPEEVAFSNGWISKDQLLTLAKINGNNSYSKYLENLIIA